MVGTRQNASQRGKGGRRHPQKGPKAPNGETVCSPTQARCSLSVQAQERKACAQHLWPGSQWGHWGNCSLGRALYSRPWGPAAAAVLQCPWLRVSFVVTIPLFQGQLPWLLLNSHQVPQSLLLKWLGKAWAEKGLWCPSLSQSHWTQNVKDGHWKKRHIHLQICRTDSLRAPVTQFPHPLKNWNDDDNPKMKEDAQWQDTFSFP